MQVSSLTSVTSLKLAYSDSPKNDFGGNFGNSDSMRPDVRLECALCICVYVHNKIFYKSI